MIPKERILRLQELFDNNPNDSFLTFALAKEWEKQGDRKQALLLYQRLRRRDPDYVGLYYHLGKLREDMGDPEAALEAYEAGMEVARRAADTHALQELAAARLNLRDPDDGEE